MAHEEAVNEFLKAPEPILVEVKRRIGPLASADQQHTISSLANDFSAKTASITNTESAIPATSSSTALSNTVSTAMELRNETTTSIGVQTDLMSNFDNDYLFGNHESPTSDGPLQHPHHLNSQTLPSSRHSNHQQPSHHHSHCNMLSDCIVPPDIDIEVIKRIEVQNKLFELKVRQKRAKIALKYFVLV